VLSPDAEEADGALEEDADEEDEDVLDSSSALWASGSPSSASFASGRDSSSLSNASSCSSDSSPKEAAASLLTFTTAGGELALAAGFFSFSGLEAEELLVDVDEEFDADDCDEEELEASSSPLSSSS